MKRFIYISIIAVATILTSCQQELQQLLDENPYLEGSKKLNITLVYPQGYESENNGGAEITISNPSNGAIYKLQTNSQGKATIDLQYGFYRLSASDKGTPVSGAIPIFNKSIDQVRLTDTLKGDLNLSVELILSYSGQLIIKELYYSGCVGPDSKTYSYDKYAILYNNSDEVAYLDSVCFATVDPYNAPTSQTPWSYVAANGQTVIRDSIPIVEAVWQFPGNGKSHPLQPGEQAVVAINAAIDNTILRPNSVNLNIPGYWVTYNQRYTNASYHPSPGPNLANHWLDLLWKQGTSTAFVLSNTSPAVVIFRIPVSGAQAFVNDPANRKRKPGSSSSNEYVMIPSAWMLDGVECFDRDTKFKRLPGSVDSGYALLGDGDRNIGKTLHRKVDALASQKAGGRIVYMDTNNSNNDFEIRASQSIKN